MAVAHDFPILLRAWFVFLGALFVLLAWRPRGPWYFKRTNTRIPVWLHRLFTIGMGMMFILAGIFGHLSN